nr:FAD-dependent oxidoreductase [Mycolicibacterium iranicum]
MTVAPWAKATFSSRVGMSTVRPGNRTALPNLALAGDRAHDDWPTTMEDAAQSASRAVDLIHRHLGGNG